MSKYFAILALVSLLLAATAASAEVSGVVTMMSGDNPARVEITDDHLIIDGQEKESQAQWCLYAKYPVNGMAKIVENWTVISEDNSSVSFWRYTDISADDTDYEDVCICG